MATSSTPGPGGSFESNKIVLDTVLTDTTLHLSFPLDSAAKYYWHVAAQNLGGTGSYSHTYIFRTSTAIRLPAAPLIVFPQVRATGVSREPVFKWNSSSYSGSYEFQIATNYQSYLSGDSAGMFLSQNVLLDTTMSDTSFQFPFALDSSSTYFWQVRGINAAGTGQFSSTGVFTTGNGVTAVDEPGGVSLSFDLLQNYPNPFNPTTEIGFQIADAGSVTLKVYDVLGQRASTLIDKVERPGKYEVQFNGSRLPSGVFFCKPATPSYTKIRKMALLK